MGCLETLRLSKAQKAAVQDSSPRLLVAAGAGSGKTSLLVAYFVHALIDQKVPPQDLVAVTFTRKAAAELAGRIRNQLLACGRDDLAKALELSTIGTIHSLCRKLIKSRPLEARVDPNFAVLETDAAAMMKKEVCTEVWQELVEEATDHQLVVVALEPELRQHVVPVYDGLRMAGQEAPQVELSLGAPSLSELQDRLERAIAQAFDAAKAKNKPSKSLEKNLDRLAACQEWLQTTGRLFCQLQADSGATAARAPSADPSLLQVQAALQATGRFIPDRTVRSMEEWFDPVRQILGEYRLGLAGLYAGPVVAAMNELLRRFHARYTEAKTERGVLDFADLELRALALVRKYEGVPGAFFGPDARILVDEFQDTNELQCGILEKLGASVLVMVGDERQSIYRFRGADVEVFRRRETELEALAAEKGEAPEAAGLHRLVDNYRSSKGILNFVNELFASPQFFGERFVKLEYARTEPEGRPTPKRAVDLLVVQDLDEATDSQDPEPLTVEQGEAEAVAWAVQKLMEEEHWEPRDIAVLTPALTHVAELQEALAARGIPYYLVRGKGYYMRDEVADVRALLKLLLNPHDDMALATVLRSPLVELSDDALFLLGALAKDQRCSLWAALAREARGREQTGAACQGATGMTLPPADQAAVEQLVARRAVLLWRVGRPGLAALIDEAISEFEYDLALLSFSDGEKQFANIRKLLRLADEYEAMRGPDLWGFVALLEEMAGLSEGEGSAPTLAEGENVVRVMTIHQAKGLQFPVVVLTGLAGGARRESRKLFVTGGEGSVGFYTKVRGSRDDEPLPCGAAARIVEEENQRRQDEDLRLLYVAMTRAEDRLVLVGTKRAHSNNRLARILAALEQQLDRPEGPPPEPKAEIFWVTRSQLLSPARRPASTATSAAWEASSAGAVSSGAVPSGPVVPTFLAPFLPVVLPRQLSFSTLAAYTKCPRRFYLERVLGLQLEQVAPQPDEEGVEFIDSWLDGEEVQAGRDVGILVHALLQHLPLTGPKPDLQSLQRTADEVMCELGLGLAPSAEQRALQLTQAFWRSPLVGAAGLAQAGKEVPFCFVLDGFLISGVMDLVLRQQGTVWDIVDYKTNSLGRRPPAAIAAGYDLQACIYALAALSAGASKVHMQFLFLEQPEAPVCHTLDRTDRGRLETQLQEVLEPLKRGEFSSSGQGCGECPPQRICAGQHGSRLDDGIQ